MFGTFLGNNQPAQKIREEDFWEICPQSVSLFFLQNILQKVWELFWTGRYYQICWRIWLNECFGRYLVKYVFGIILGVMSQKVVLQIHQGDTSHKLRGPFLEHSFNIFWYVPQKICGGKYAGLVRQKKRSGLFVEGIPQQMFWGMVKWLLQKTIAIDIFFCPKSVWRNVAFDISNIFRQIFACVSQKHILKTFAKCFWEIRHRKHVNKEAYPKPVCSQFILSAAKFPIFRECSGKCLLLSIWRKISNKKSQQLLKDMKHRSENKSRAIKQKWKLCPRTGLTTCEMHFSGELVTTSLETWFPKLCQTHVWQDITHNIRSNKSLNESII